MKSEANTEKGMREATVPTPDTLEELSSYVKSLTDRQHDYGTCVYAMSMAGTAAFNYVVRKLWATGFQASCADMDILKRTRRIRGPFMVLKLEDALYPQYDLHSKLDEMLKSEDSIQWLADEARKLQLGTGVACEEVKNHWMKLAAMRQEKGTK